MTGGFSMRTRRSRRERRRELLDEIKYTCYLGAFFAVLFGLGIGVGLWIPG